MPTIQDLLENRDFIITDGAMGTVLFAAGLEQGDPPELWNIKHPERVAAVHQAYLEAQRARPGERLFPSVRAFPGGGAPKPPQLRTSHRRTRLPTAA